MLRSGFRIAFSERRRHLRAASGLAFSGRADGSASLSALEYNMQLDSAVETFKDRKTKIVCTLGPSSSSPAQIRDLLLSGLDVARINCAHGDRASYAALVDSLRSASDGVRRGGLRSVDEVSRPDVGVAALAFDIKGPEIRVGRFSPAVPLNSSGSRQIPLHRGERILLSTSAALADAGSKEAGIYVAYPLLAQHVRAGSRIYIDDGNVELLVVSSDQAAGTVVAVSLTDSPLLERKGVNLPGVTVELPHVTRKDEADMATARALGADFVFASFVQFGAMVREIRSALGPGIGIISKIESQAGIDAYDDILAESDGIMVARGDLGVQIPPERVFLAQKRLVARANVAGKPVICATQMLESMTTNARPTRAECVDVASAVLDGADAVMLSGETAKGKNPAAAVQMMSRICQAAEAAFAHRQFFNALTAIVDTAYIRPTMSRGREGVSCTAAKPRAGAGAGEFMVFGDGGDFAAGVGRSGEGAAPTRSAALMPPAAPASEAAAFAAAQHEAAVANTAGAIPAAAEAMELEDGSHMTSADVETLASAAVHAAFEVNAALIVVVTVSGRTAALVSKYRPHCPILCATPDDGVARKLQMYRGLHAVVVPPGSSVAQCKRLAIAAAKVHGIAESGDRVVSVHGAHTMPGGDSGQAGVQVTMAHVL